MKKIKPQDWLKEATKIQKDHQEKVIKDLTQNQKIKPVTNSGLRSPLNPLKGPRGRTL